MKYFSKLPTVITKDANNNLLALKNLLVRTSLLPQLADSPLLYYKYAIQDGDTPETVAFKYYGDQYRYWIVLHGNGSLNPQWDWTLSNQQFQAYLLDKYTSDTATSLGIPISSVTPSHVLAYTSGTVHHYEKVITSMDGDSQTTAIKNVEIDLDTYNALVPRTQITNLSDGSTVNYSVSGNIISIYDYEYAINESKREINLIDKKYVSTMETQFEKLMGS